MYTYIKSLIFLSICVCIESLIIYKSNQPIENNGAHVGLKYQNILNKQNISWTKGLSACIRFNYEKLNNFIFYLGSKDLAYLSVKVQWVVDGFDFKQGEIKYEVKSTPVFWFPWYKNDNQSSISVNFWHHMCIGIDLENSDNSKITLILVRTQNF